MGGVGKLRLDCAGNGMWRASVNWKGIGDRGGADQEGTRGVC